MPQGALSAPCVDDTKTLWGILACPQCGHSLSRSDAGALCGSCGAEYGRAASGQLDLQPKGNKRYRFEFQLPPPCAERRVRFEQLRENPAPEVDFRDCPVPERLTTELLSYFPRAKSRDSIVLDLGCGSGTHRVACERAGFEYLGIDLDSPAATLLADAHALPLRDNSVEFVLSVAVLQYSPLPFVMTREVCRVLKPGGWFIGTVAFLEPFHDTYYHHTHLGTANVLRQGGLAVHRVAPSDEWSVLVAQARMALFPRMPTPVSAALVWPLGALHKLWWRAGSLLTSQADETIRIRNTTGSFTFLASKPR